MQIVPKISAKDFVDKITSSSQFVLGFEKFGPLLSDKW